VFASLFDNDDIIIISNDCENLWRLLTGVSRSVMTDVFIRSADIPGCDIVHKLSSALRVDNLKPWQNLKPRIFADIVPSTATIKTEQP
jgi:hypothetical protein